MFDVRIAFGHIDNIGGPNMKLHNVRRTLPSENSSGEWKMGVVGHALSNRMGLWHHALALHLDATSTCFLLVFSDAYLRTLL